MRFSGAALLVLIISLMGCAHAPWTARELCARRLSTPQAQSACLDRALQELALFPEGSLAILKRLCEEKHLARACSNAAYALDNPGGAATPQSSSAVKFYRRGCELGDGIGCNNLANLYIFGRGTPPDEAEGVRALQRSCELDYAGACYRVAVITLRGKLLKRDEARAAQLFQKGCAFGDAASCHDLGYLYMEGNGVVRDMPRALQLIARACDQGLPRACGTLGWSYMQGSGPGGVDFLRARELLERACSGDDAPSCGNLGYMVETGKGAQASPARALQIYIKACDKGDTLGCGNLGELLADGRGAPRDDNAALPYLDKGCAGRVAEACRYLADFHEAGRAGLPRSPATAKFYHQQACEQGDEPSCAILAKSARTLCGRREEVAFSCMTGEKRMISLCLAPRKTGQALVYRFGTKNKLALELSGLMSLRSEAWSVGEKATVSFANASARYVLTEEIDKSSDPPPKKAKLEIEQGGQTVRLDCRYPIIGGLKGDRILKAVNISAQ